MVRVGFIGLGKMGQLHFSNCRFIDDVKVVAAADTSKSALNSVKNEGVKSEQLFTDYNEMFRKTELDAVVISVPNFLHVDAVTAAAEHGVDVFVEKPLAKSVQESEDIVRVADKNGISVMVDHNYRFLKSIQTLHEKYTSGELGDVKIATLEFVMNGPFTATLEPFPVPEWWFDVEKMGGGVIMDLGYHMVDLFRWMFGEVEVDYVKPSYHYNMSLEDTAVMVVHSKDTGTDGVVNTGWFSRMVFPNFNFRVILHGTAGFASTDSLGPGNLYVHAGKEGISNMLRRVTFRKIKPLTYTYYYTSYLESLRNFFSSVQNECETPVTARDGLETVKLLSDCYKLIDLAYSLKNANESH